MFPCCSHREKRNSQKNSSAINARSTATTNEALPATNPTQHDAKTHQNEHFDSGAHPSTSEPEPEPEFDLNSSIFMPDPSRKKKPSPFELASASYAEATDFSNSAGGEHLPSLGEGEEDEEAKASRKDGK